jgi:hypothetical protein
MLAPDKPVIVVVDKCWDGIAKHSPGNRRDRLFSPPPPGASLKERRRSLLQHHADAFFPNDISFGTISFNEGMLGYGHEDVDCVLLHLFFKDDDHWKPTTNLFKSICQDVIDMDICEVALGVCPPLFDVRYGQFFYKTRTQRNDSQVKKRLRRKGFHELPSHIQRLIP